LQRKPHDPKGCLTTLTKNHRDSSQNLTNRPNQSIKQKGNHRGWCVAQRTKVAVPQRIGIVAHRGQGLLSHRGHGLLPTEDKGTDQQTSTNNLDQTKTRTKSHLLPFQSREDPRPLLTVSPAVITVVHSVEVCAMYPRIVISSPFND
jgi:hypothetical protein